MTTISIASDFSPSPAGRTPADGPFNGQRFREEFLIPALQAATGSGEKVTVNLDGAYSYSSSFLEEVFGGVVRVKKFAPEVLTRQLEISAENPIYASFRRDAQSYLADALKQLKASAA
ncbi:STAS-like domain-containing protein [Bradyrhizobium sp. CCGUVB23]|uniref:STAS-like domain-containing protein n=1 Tax=Bradyrhizobium sp. CCGUVB23 TaxID=2949630 RepID=UPI0020B249FF|nr:STAS-like domain-containing protein [Bradyrhizobium sp. CCGUVB23]MCP3467991.1 STAS-like domain-containing protein [Bradyrhizobium sp. CCGUVB23]